MGARTPLDSEVDSELVDPSFGVTLEGPPSSTRPSHPSSRPSQPSSRPSQPSANVLVGGGEREARAYVPPTALPAGPALKGPDTSSKVAIASSVDPRRMPTVRISSGRSNPPPAERPAPIDAMGPYGLPVPRLPPVRVEEVVAPPRVAPPPVAPKREGAASSEAKGGSSAVWIWVLAVALAAALGTGGALWIRKTMAGPADPPAPTEAPRSP